MKCEKCHEKEATVFITQNINGEILEMNLCESCAAEQDQHLLDEEFSFKHFLTGFIDGRENGQVEQTFRCPNCGMSLMDFKRHSKVGCAQCYSEFSNHLLPVIRRLHGTAKHTGKHPARVGALVNTKKQLEDFESRLKVALMKEDYEEAARFRDKIRDLKDREDML